MSTPINTPAGPGAIPEEHPRPSFGTIFLVLFVLTVVEIAVANLHFAKVYIVSGLVGLAILKAALVGMFYMHLKFEKKLLALIILAPLVFSFIFAYGIGSDMQLNKPKRIVDVKP